MSYSWTEEDEIIALSAYFSISDNKSRHIVAVGAVELVNRRSLRKGGSGFNNTNSMKMKFRGFDALSNQGGLAKVSKKSKEIWVQYHNNPNELKKRMEEIKAKLDE